MGSSSLSFSPALQQVAHVDDAFDVVDLFAIDRQARILRFDHHVAGFTHGRGYRHGHDVRPRRHHFAHARVAKFDDRMNQFALFFFENSFCFADIDQRLDVVAVVVFLILFAVFSHLFLAPRAIEES